MCAVMAPGKTQCRIETVHDNDSVNKNVHGSWSTLKGNLGCVEDIITRLLDLTPFGNWWTPVGLFQTVAAVKNLPCGACEPIQ